MKRSLLGAILVVCGLLATAPTARADAGEVSFSTTNTVRSSTTLTATGSGVGVGNVIRVDNQDNVGIWLFAQGDAAGTGAITVTFKRSMDGTTNTMETTPRFTWATALNGNTAVVAYTNLSSALIGAAPYLHIHSLQNADAGASATNFSIYLEMKNVKHAP